jgi:site-specific recombinase XerD
VQDIGRRDLERYLLDLAGRNHDRTPDKPVSAATVAKHYRSLQQFFRWLQLEEEITESPFVKESPPAVQEQPVPLLASEDFSRVLDVCKGSDFDARRDTAIFRLLLDSGLRVAELIGISVDDLNFDQDVVLVLGKGRRERAGLFGNRTGEAFRRCLRKRTRHPHGRYYRCALVGPQGGDDATGRSRRRGWPGWLARRPRLVTLVTSRVH